MFLLESKRAVFISKYLFQAKLNRTKLRSAKQQLFFYF